MQNNNNKLSESKTFNTKDPLADIISEKDLIALTGYTRWGLLTLRRKGVITAKSINGKKLMYSRKEIAQLLK
jgi:hypothetical protein